MAIQRAQCFGEENITQLSSAVDLTGARQRLDDIVASFAANAFDQSANDRGAKGETLKQQQLRDKLRTEQMQRIAEIARRNLRTVPEFKSLQMPRQTSTGPAFIARAPNGRWRGTDGLHHGLRLEEPDENARRHGSSFPSR